MLTSVKAGVGVVVALIVLAGGAWAWNSWRDARNAERAELQARIALRDSLIATQDRQLQQALANAGRVDTVIDRVILTRPLPPLPPRPEIPRGVALDSAQADSLLDYVDTLEVRIDTLLRRDSVQRATLIDARVALSELARRAFVSDSTKAAQIVDLQRLVDLPKPRRRWGVGGGCGYGVVLSRELVSGPTCLAGLVFSF